MQLSICDRFPAVSPFELRKQRFSEVFLLVRRLNKTGNKAELKNNTKHYEKVNGKTRVYVPVK